MSLNDRAPMSRGIRHLEVDRFARTFYSTSTTSVIRLGESHSWFHNGTELQLFWIYGGQQTFNNTSGKCQKCCKLLGFRWVYSGARRVTRTQAIRRFSDPRSARNPPKNFHSPQLFHRLWAVGLPRMRECEELLDNFTDPGSFCDQLQYYLIHHSLRISRRSRGIRPQGECSTYKYNHLKKKPMAISSLKPCNKLLKTHAILSISTCK